MSRATLKTRLGLAIAIASIAFVVFLIVTGTTINGFTLWG
jgi:hypothetical protein